MSEKHVIDLPEGGVRLHVSPIRIGSQILNRALLAGHTAAILRALVRTTVEKVEVHFAK